ncbi:MAG TPA: hypothetical protein VKB86_12070, partial [Pyrinomonadaceae bacterium]|nr:hypothetical protein [Pyrinomonadaceae bacterium]
METVCKRAGAVTSVAFSPDGACIASASEESAHGSNPLISIWELQTGEMIELGECDGRSTQIAYSPGGHNLAAASSETENGLRIWNLLTGHTRTFKSDACGFSSISFSPVMKSVVVGENSLNRAALQLYDLDADQSRILGHCDRRITAVAFSPDGKQIAFGGWDETVRLWNVQAGKMSVLGKNCSRVNCVAFSRKGDHLAVCSLDGRIRVWNMHTTKSRTIGECYGIRSVTLSVDGRSVIAGCTDGTVRQWRFPALL